MLPLDDQLQELTRIVGPLRSHISVPASWFELKRSNQPRSSIHNDSRKFARWILPTIATARYGRSLSPLSRSDEWYLVYTVDISRNGICFLHAEQAYPTEQMQLMFASEKQLFVEVVRCRCLQPQCFEIGAQFRNELSASAGPESADTSQVPTAAAC